MIRKIVVIGPESTGKSTLCQQLAAHYKTEWVPEYAREYLLKHGMKYSYDDLLTIAKGQLELEERYIQAKMEVQQSRVNQLLFIDTDMYVMKVWCEFVFEKCHQWIIDLIADRTYDLYLLCNIDLPWSFDPLREYPNQEPRERLYRIYKDILINQATPWVEIGGDYQQRFATAIGAIDRTI